MKKPTSLGWRSALATAAVVAVVATPLTGVQAAHAQDPYPPDDSEISLSATTVAPGGQLFFRAEGFEPDQEVVAVLLSRARWLGVFYADEHGVVTGSVTIPRRVKPGWHTFELRAEDPDRTLSADLLVLPCDRHHRCGDDDPCDRDHRCRDDDPCDDDRRCGDDDRRKHPSGHHKRNESQVRQSGGDDSPLHAGGAVAMVLVGGGGLLGARRLKKR